MIETILLARERKTGNYVPLSSFGEPWDKLKESLQKFNPDTHNEYDRIGLYHLVPQKKVLKLVSDDEHKSAQDVAKGQQETYNKAQAAKAPPKPIDETSASDKAHKAQLKSAQETFDKDKSLLKSEQKNQNK